MPAKTDSANTPIPDKRYFPIGEASALCGVKAHVLRYWEQEFPQLSPSKRRGNRRYYRADDIRMARQIRELLYDQGFTIAGARARLAESLAPGSTMTTPGDRPAVGPEASALADIRRALERIVEKLDA